MNTNFAKSACEQCQGHIEFDAAYEGLKILCPHCGSETKLLIATGPLPQPKVQPEVVPEKVETGCDVLPGPWIKDPMTQKQKGMFVLYGIPLTEGLTKGDASKLIDEAKKSGVRPSEQDQARAEKIFKAAERDAEKQKLKLLCDELLEIARLVYQKKTTSREIEGFKLRFQEISEEVSELLDARSNAVDEEECERQNREYEKQELGD